MGHSPLPKPHPRWGEVHPLPRPYLLGTYDYGALTPHLRRDLDAFGSWSRHLCGLSPSPPTHTVKLLATSLPTENNVTVFMEMPSSINKTTDNLRYMTGIQSAGIILILYSRPSGHSASRAGSNVGQGKKSRPQSEVFPSLPPNDFLVNVKNCIFVHTCV